MRLVANCKTIRVLRRKLKSAVFLLNRRKRVCQKWKLLGHIGRCGLMKRTLRRIKRKNVFTQKNLQKKTFIFKRTLVLRCTTFSYNLCVFLKSKAEYVSLKQTLDVSGLSFDFWFLTKQWMVSLLKQNAQNKQLIHAFNGAMLIIRCKNIQEVIANFLVFNQPQTFCGGFFFQNRFFWPEDFFTQIISVDARCKMNLRFVSAIAHRFFSKLQSFFVRVLAVLKFRGEVGIVSKEITLQ